MNDGDIIEKDGRRFRVNIEPDEYRGPPWENSDGYGVVSEWTSREKQPGERILSQDRSSKRYYDIAATMKIAANDWGLSEEDHTKLVAKLGRTPTKGEVTAQAVENDFENLRQWCNDVWGYVGVIVTDITDEEDAEINYTHALWGIESNSGDKYLREVAEALVDDALSKTIHNNPGKD